MSKDGTVAVVAVMPMCDICKNNGDETVPAQYDGRTKSGPWANMCITHFNLHGVGLGTGKGQKLVLEENTYRESTMREGFDCAMHGLRHPLIAQWDCYDDLLQQAIAQANS
jgi:hypothetical protein